MQELTHWHKLRDFLGNGIEYLNTLPQTEKIKGQINGYEIVLNEMEIIEKHYIR